MWVSPGGSDEQFALRVTTEDGYFVLDGVQAPCGPQGCKLSG